MVEHLVANQMTRVRFPVPAHKTVNPKACLSGFTVFADIGNRKRAARIHMVRRSICAVAQIAARRCLAVARTRASIAPASTKAENLAGQVFLSYVLPPGFSPYRSSTPLRFSHDLKAAQKHRKGLRVLVAQCEGTVLVLTCYASAPARIRTWNSSSEDCCDIRFTTRASRYHTHDSLARNESTTIARCRLTLRFPKLFSR